MNIKDLSYRDLPEIMTYNGWGEWDENKIKREGYVMGANAILKEIENILKLGYGSIYKFDMIEDKVKELKMSTQTLDDKIEDYITNHFSEGDDGCMISDLNKCAGGVTYDDLAIMVRHFVNER